MGIQIGDVGDFYRDTFIKWITGDDYDKFRAHYCEVLSAKLDEVEAKRDGLLLQRPGPVHNGRVTKS